MHDTTADDMELLLKEENIATLTHLIQQAVNATGITQAVTELQQARTELQEAREELKEAATKFVTVEESKKTVQEFADQIREPLTESVNNHLAELKEEENASRQAINQQIGEMKALVITTEQDLATHKATTDQQFKQIETRLDKVENEIKTGIAAVAKNSRTLSRAVGRWLEESRVQKEKTDLDIKALKEADTEAAQKIKALESDARSAIDLAKEVDSLAARNYQALNHAILGNKETKTDGLVDTIRALKQEVKEQIEELRKDHQVLETEQEKINDGTWWLVWIGHHPYITASTIASSIVLLLITIAGIFGRPDIVEAIVRTAK